MGEKRPDLTADGEGGIRTLDGRNRPYRFSRPAHSTALPPLRLVSQVSATGAQERTGAAHPRQEPRATRGHSLAPPRREERPQQIGRLLRKQPGRHLGAMVQPGLGEDVEHAARRPGLRIGRREHDTRDSRQHNRTRAHRTGLERHVEHGVEHSPAADRPSGLAQGDHLGVSGGVGADLALVVPGADDLAVPDHEGPDRNVVVLECPGRLPERQAHEVLVSWKEMGCHRQDGRYRCGRATSRVPMMS